MTPIMFETFIVPVVYLVIQTILFLYALRGTTGVVMDSHEVSLTVSINDVYALSHDILLDFMEFLRRS